jgi:hypothetical protein
MTAWCFLVGLKLCSLRPTMRQLCLVLQGGRGQPTHQPPRLVSICTGAILNEAKDILARALIERKSSSLHRGGFGI